MQVTFLGTGCAMVLRRYNTCFLLENEDDKLLVDAGGGNEILVRLERIGVKIRDIGGIFVTHSHSDHILGVPWVIRSVGTAIAEAGYTGTFTVAACRETLEHVRSICEMILGKKITKYFDSQIIFKEVTDGEKLHFAGFDMECFDICSKKMKQFGFLLELPDGKKLCFPGDEPLKPECEKYAKGAQWLFSEAYCLYSDKDKYLPYQRSHVTALDTGRLAGNMGVDNLVIFHTEDYGDDRRELMSAEAKSEFSGNVYVPEDMETIKL